MRRRATIIVGVLLVLGLAWPTADRPRPVAPPRVETVAIVPSPPGVPAANNPDMETVPAQAPSLAPTTPPVSSLAHRLPELTAAAARGEPEAICERSHGLHRCQRYLEQRAQLPNLEDRAARQEKDSFGERELLQQINALASDLALDEAYCAGLDKVDPVTTFEALSQAASSGDAAAAAELFLHGPGVRLGGDQGEMPLWLQPAHVIAARRQAWKEHETHRLGWAVQAVQAGDLAVVDRLYGESIGEVAGVFALGASLDPVAAVQYAEVLRLALEPSFDAIAEQAFEDASFSLSPGEIAAAKAEGARLFTAHFQSRRYTPEARHGHARRLPETSCPGARGVAP